MANLEKFVNEKLAEIGKRSFIGNDDYFEIEFDIEKIVSRLERIDVYRMTQEEINEQLEDYPDYYEDLKEGDVVYFDGETPFEIEAVDYWLSEIRSSWRKGEYMVDESDVAQYITYLYAQELAKQLTNEQNHDTSGT